MDRPPSGGKFIRSPVAQRSGWQKLSVRKWASSLMFYSHWCLTLFDFGKTSYSKWRKLLGANCWSQIVFSSFISYLSFLASFRLLISGVRFLKQEKWASANIPRSLTQEFMGHIIQQDTMEKVDIVVILCISKEWLIMSLLHCLCQPNWWEVMTLKLRIVFRQNYWLRSSEGSIGSRHRKKKIFIVNIVNFKST